jgi:protein-S-isoprenylcysteine O-methyltransferase Ste14
MTEDGGDTLNMHTDSASRTYGIVQSTVFCLFAAVVLFDRSRTLVRASPTLRWTGAGLAVAGLVLMFAAIRTMGHSIQIAPAPKPSATLATRGVYGRLRHPIYTGIILIVIGLFLRQPTILVAAGAAGVIGFLLIKSRFEERLLLAAYADYAEYRTRAWGVIPFL